MAMIISMDEIHSIEWPPFGHELIGHESLTTLEQWKASKHWSL